MVKTTTYKVRSGPGMPIMGDSDISAGVVIFTFGSETQKIEAGCSNEIDITSKDMCLMGGAYFSASFKAMPGTVDGNLIFSSTKATKPIMAGSTDGNMCDLSNNSNQPNVGPGVE